MSICKNIFVPYFFTLIEIYTFWFYKCFVEELSLDITVMKKSSISFLLILTLRWLIMGKQKIGNEYE
jgi:hypothetical protein